MFAVVPQTRRGDPLVVQGVCSCRVKGYRLPWGCPNTSARGTRLDKLFARRALWNMLPIGLVVSALWFALAGDEGLLKRHTVKQRLIATEKRVSEQERENEEMKARIRSLRRDPNALRRVAAEHLLMAESGSTIYRFVEPPSTAGPVPVSPTLPPADLPTPQATSGITGAP